MTSAELSARRTAARAVLNDFLRDHADTIGLALWAGRLGNELAQLLDQLDQEDAE